MQFGKSYGGGRDSRSLSAQDCVPQRGLDPAGPEKQLHLRVRPAPLGTKGQSDSVGFRDIGFLERSFKASYICSSDSARTTRAPVPCVTASLNYRRGDFTGEARRDCSDACRAMRCQRSTRFVAAAARCASVR